MNDAVPQQSDRRPSPVATSRTVGFIGTSSLGERAVEVESATGADPLDGWEVESVYCTAGGGKERDVREK